MGQRKLSFITVQASRTQSRTERKTGTDTGCLRDGVKALSWTLLHAEGNKPESVTPSQQARSHSCKVHCRSSIYRGMHSP